jgi:hypothetical protein
VEIFSADGQGFAKALPRQRQVYNVLHQASPMSLELEETRNRIYSTWLYITMMTKSPPWNIRREIRLETTDIGSIVPFCQSTIDILLVENR